MPVSPRALLCTAGKEFPHYSSLETVAQLRKPHRAPSDCTLPDHCTHTYDTPAHRFSWGALPPHPMQLHTRYQWFQSWSQVKEHNQKQTTVHCHRISPKEAGGPPAVHSAPWKTLLRTLPYGVWEEFPGPTWSPLYPSSSFPQSPVMLRDLVQEWAGKQICIQALLMSGK